MAPRKRRWAEEGEAAGGVGTGAEGEALLPQLEPPDLCDERWRLSEEELHQLLPPGLPPCPLELRPAGQQPAAGAGAGPEPTLVPLGEARCVDAPGLAVLGGQPEASRHVLLDAGCFVSAAAFAPGCLEGLPDGPAHVLALGVHNRAQPVTVVEQRMRGLAAVQLWRVSASCQDASLCLGLVHDGACARSLQWLPGTRTESRLGLLLLVLGDGALELQAVAVEPFARPCAAEPTAGPPMAELMLRLPPAWVAPVALPGALPKAAWDRRVCCAAAQAGMEAGSCLLAAGSDRAVLLLWRLQRRGDLPAGPCSLFHAPSPEKPSVWSLAWAPERGRELLAAGLANGVLLLWDCRLPAAPVYCYFTQVHSPIWSMEWSEPGHICLQQLEAAILNLSTKKATRLLFGLNRRHTVDNNCSALCRARDCVATAWTDGRLLMRPACHEALRPARVSQGRMLAAWHLVGAVEPPARASPALVQPGGAAGGPLTEGRKAELAELFREKQASHHATLRPWESPCAAASALRLRVELGEAPRPAAATERPPPPMPLSALAATRAGEGKALLLACCSASGLVQISLWP